MCVIMLISVLSFECLMLINFFFFFQAEDGIRDRTVTGVQTCALPILELGIAPASPDHLARLSTEEDPDPPLEELQPDLPAEPLVLRLLGRDVGLAALEVREPRSDPRRLLGVAGIGMDGVSALGQLEGAVH